MGGVDLHLHSTASDGEVAPEAIAAQARAAGLALIALTDHDTLAGIPAARAAAQAAGIELVAGCEFSVAAGWGEMHLLAYYLPSDEAEVEDFLAEQRARRISRGQEMVRRLCGLGVELSYAEVRVAAGAGVVGRPHVAKALVARGLVRDVAEAFERYLAAGRPAYVPKELPAVSAVVRLVRAAGGVTSAAHLKERADAAALAWLKAAGVDAVEVAHPAHDARVRRRIARHARRLGLLLSGGSDWHGDARVDDRRGALGTVTVPLAWAEALYALHRERTRGR